MPGINIIISISALCFAAFVIWFMNEINKLRKVEGILDDNYDPSYGTKELRELSFQSAMERQFEVWQNDRPQWHRMMGEPMSDYEIYLWYKDNVIKESDSDPEITKRED